jgi:hypothetical protein
MPCLLINSYSFNQPIQSGDSIIGTGTSVERDTPMSFYYNYSYSGMFLTPTQLSAIPNGATITRLEYQYEIPTNGTYSITNVDSYMFQTPASYTRFPSGNTRVSGNSSSWDFDITNYFQTEYSTSISYQKISSDPNIQFRGFNLTNPYSNFDNTKNLCIVFNSTPASYTSGSQTYPRILGTSGNNFGTSYFDERDGSAYSLNDFVNFQLSFYPNIKIYWT